MVYLAKFYVILANFVILQFFYLLFMLCVIRCYKILSNKMHYVLFVLEGR